MEFIAFVRNAQSRVAARLSWLPPTLTRLTLGWVFILSGWGKLNHLPKVIAFFTELGIPAPQFQAGMVATFEFVGGALILVGLLTRLAVVPLIGTMVVALITAKASEIAGPSDLFGISEYLYIVLFIWLAITGAGPFSIDRLLARRRGSAGASPPSSP
jgi:putative oxidoreductase